MSILPSVQRGPCPEGEAPSDELLLATVVSDLSSDLGCQRPLGKSGALMSPCKGWAGLRGWEGGRPPRSPFPAPPVLREETRASIPHWAPCRLMLQLPPRPGTPLSVGGSHGYNGEGGTGPLRLSAGPHQSFPAVWTRTRTATHRSWPSPSVCAGAASAPGPAGRQQRSTPCRCTRACWCCAASPAPWTRPGRPPLGPLPSTWSPSGCPSAAPVSCPGWYGDHWPQRSPCAVGRGHLSDWTAGITLQRGPLVFMCIYWLFICPGWACFCPGSLGGYQDSKPPV